MYSKSSKQKLKNQLGKKIKAVRSNRDREYYRRYGGLGKQCPRPFIDYLAKYEIIA